MKCQINYIGKQRNGIPKYWCSIHKYIASDKQGNPLIKCLCPYKELFNNIIDVNKENLKSIKLIYNNIFTSKKPQIYVNNKEWKGVLKIGTSLLNYKDFTGIFLAKLNNIFLEKVYCNHCHKFHSDNGVFAYTPHKTHLCLFCGHMFKVKTPNISHELDVVFNIPSISLLDNIINIEEECSISYDLLKGELLINNQKGNIVIYKKKKWTCIEFINNLLKDEF